MIVLLLVLSFPYPKVMQCFSLGWNDGQYFWFRHCIPRPKAGTEPSLPILAKIPISSITPSTGWKLIKSCWPLTRHNRLPHGVTDDRRASTALLTPSHIHCTVPHPRFPTRDAYRYTSGNSGNRTLDRSSVYRG